MTAKKSKPFPLREEMPKTIADISAMLKKPGLSFAERLLLHEDRKELRRALAEMED